MSKKQEVEETKCSAINLPVYLIRKLEDFKLKTGKSKNAESVKGTGTVTENLLSLYLSP